MFLKSLIGAAALAASVVTATAGRHLRRRRYVSVSDLREVGGHV